MERRRQLGKSAPLLDALEPLPDHLLNVWGYFLALNAARGSNGFGPLPIPVSEILSTADFFCIDCEDALFFIQALDAVVMQHHAEEAKKKPSK
jgi:hypothetical protein